MSLVLQLFHQSQVDAALDELRGLIRAEDLIQTNTGNVRGAADPGRVNAWAASLRTAFPDNRIFAQSSGLDNVRRLVSGVGRDVRGIVYCYEPGFENEPEFSWDFRTTVSNVGAAASAARARGLLLYVMPTGRPLLQKPLLRHGWDYAALAQACDGLICQTQTYAVDGEQRFREAVDALAGAFRGMPDKPWYVQVTADPRQRNGVPPALAATCASYALSRGAAGVLVWWGAGQPEQFAEVARALSRR